MKKPEPDFPSFFVLALIGALLLFAFLPNNSLASNEENRLNFGDFLEKVDKGEVKTVFLTDDAEFQVKIKDNDNLYIVANPRDPSFKRELLEKGVDIKERPNIEIGKIVIAVITPLISFGLFWMFFNHIARVFIQISSKASKTGGFAVIPVKSPVKFSDIAGYEETKEEFKDVLCYLKNPEAYSKIGARCPRGILLYGSPGTGKTLFAKALAGEAGVPFYAISGSEFVQVYVGVGASRVRTLIEEAEKNAPCIIFIDEIDAIGKSRDGDASGNSEREQTLNQLLTKMDGFEKNEGIVFVAATNRVDVLDPALLRPGRFDRLIEIQLPELKTRRKIAEIHFRNKNYSEEIDLDKIAEQTVYFSGADIENLANESALLAVRNKREQILPEDVEKAFLKIVAGADKKDRFEREQDKKITAYHEAGHALVAKLLYPNNSVPRVSIIPTTKGAGGFTIHIPEERVYNTRESLLKDIAIVMGGRAAEEIVFGEDKITSGAASDIKKITEIAYQMVAELGMSSEYGMLNIKLLGVDNEKMAKTIKELTDKVYADTIKLIKENRILLDKIAHALMKEETIDNDILDQIIKNEIKEN